MMASGFSRSFVLRAPLRVPRFLTRFESHSFHVGRRAFEAYVDAVGGSITWELREPALLRSFAALADDDFAPEKVHPLIQEFYEHTDLFRLEFTIQWNPLVQPLGFLYSELVARAINQLRVPWRSSEIWRRMDSAFALIDVDGDGREDYRGWARTMADDGSMFYTGAVFAYRAREERLRRSYLCVAFPLPFANFTSVMRVKNLGTDGFEMTTEAPEARDAGSYLVFPSKSSFSMIPGLGLSEQFRFAAHPEGWIECWHEQRWLGRWAFTLHYRIHRKTGGYGTDR